MTKFTDLKLDPKVLKAIAEAGYENPTPIQAGAIPPALEGRDVLGIAQTGTGKTASFTLPMITLLGRGRARARMPRSLVLCPTRELAAQVAENFDIYAKHTKLTKALLIGGVSFGEQDKLIDRGVDVLIATPGRLLDHFERGKLLLTGVQIMVVDEADRMLDMGFIPDIERIFQLTPFTRQTLFFSATMAPEIERITNTFLHSPERIEVARQATTSETITQRLVELTPTRRDQTAKQKRELLRALIEAEGAELKNAIIFCNRKTDVDIVSKSLKKHGFDAAPIHGDLDQSQRMRTLDDFRDGKLKLLVASDVAARGLDIPAVSHVFNYDLPSHAEDYVHRIGRTGRAGRKGTAISLSTPADEKYLSAIENLVKQTLPRADLPADFSLSDAAQQPARAAAREDRRGGRNRSRGGRRGEDRAEQQTAPRAEPASAPAETVAEQPREDRRSDRREDRRDGRRGDRWRDRDGPVIGMGDHVPEFMNSVFRPGTVSSSDAADEASAPPASDPAPETTAEKPKPSRSRRKKPAASKPVEAADTAAGQPAPAAEAKAETMETEAAPAETVPTEAEEKPKKTTRSRRKKATETPVEPVPEAAAAPDSTGVATPEQQAEGEVPAKPRRTRRKKAEAPAADAADDSAVAKTEEAAKPKPKRKPRSTKAKAETPAEADTIPAAEG